MSIPRYLATAAVSLLILAGCKKEAGSAAAESNKIRVGIIGITCEAPLYMAIEQGFFKEEGLEVELVKCEWAKYKDVLALGGFDITHHLVMYFLKPIEQGLDVKFTAGVHRGCLRVQGPVEGGPRTPADLRGKRIGVPGMGTPPFIFASRVLGNAGIDAKTEVQWKVFPAAELALALQKGEVDAIADSEPIGTLFIAQGKVRNIADQATDAPYKDEYCCAVIVNGKYMAANPKATAAATRAILKGAKWVETNPAAAARISVEKKYIASNPELNTEAISHLRYIPSVTGARDAVSSAAEEMKRGGMLAASTDVSALAKKAFVELDGVSDEWVKHLQVETLADGQVPKDIAIRLARELEADEKGTQVATCCAPKTRVLK